ncbi:Predicted ATPase of the PP-loop superfamily implicated in cell cycle control [alpha proteobacterium BAL199]|jgi:tRNA(Ile)-lysidine synthase|nr:Predicted ATPase of the PP-loop superfamily implicated in cell cycle control [alpha proteobacterium BAL199]
MALLHLTDAWARGHGRALLVYTVDHGLRPEAVVEAGRVGQVCAMAGRPHRILRWLGTKPGSGLQAAARRARYDLMAQACRDDGVVDLLLAHHLEDQAETVLHRIDRGTGPDGLAGMARVRAFDGVRLLRPLLDVPKVRLLATCRSVGVEWAEDPSNSDPRFARTELRQLAPVLADVGVTSIRLGRLASAMASARAALDGFTADWMAQHASVLLVGAVRMNRAVLVEAPVVLRRRLIDRALRAIGGNNYPLRSDGLERLLAWIEADRPETRTRTRTLAGCRVEIAGDGLTILRDWRQAARPVVIAAHGRGRWDCRFEIENPTSSPVRVGVCGGEGWRRWRRTAQSSALAGRPMVAHAARLALPAVLDLDGGIGLPHLVHSAPAPSGWVGEDVRIRFRPTVPFLTTDRRPGDGVDPRPSQPCNGRQAT